jgi:hypothetical protein
MTEALLLTMMDPPQSGDAEFNDWANLEHIPQRREIPGFRTALRFQNKVSSPRYMAIYDIDDRSVLQSPPYLAISGENLSPWSKRILAGASARWRFEGSRIGALPDRFPTGAKGSIAELLLIIWRGVPERCDEAIASILKRTVGDLPGVIQLRGFVGERESGVDYVAIVESTQAFGAEFTDRARFATSSQACDSAGVFVPIAVGT